MKSNLIKNISLVALLLVSREAGYSQGFINMNFEQAKPVPLVGGPFPNSVAATNALPGWTVYEGGSTVNWVVTNDLALGAAWVSLHSTSDPYASYYGGVIQGNYTVLLQPSFPGATDSAAIGQIGLVPITALSLLLDANGPISVFFAGQQIPLSVLGTGANYTIYGGDVSAFAGQTGELLFQANAISPSGWGTSLDNILFSNQSVPEPCALAVGALGTLLFSFRRWWNSSR
jgi:hypothetical protein